MSLCASALLFSPYFLCLLYLLSFCVFFCRHCQGNPPPPLPPRPPTCLDDPHPPCLDPPHIPPGQWTLIRMQRSKALLQIENILIHLMHSGGVGERHPETRESERGKRTREEKLQSCVDVLHLKSSHALEIPAHKDMHTHTRLCTHTH